MSTTEAGGKVEVAPDQRRESGVSFVVIAYNEAANIDLCLRSVLDQKGAPLLEVVVVDDGSTDTTPEVVRSVARLDRRVHLVRLPTNCGRGNARATGVARSRGDLVAMVDADVVLPADWLERCITALDGKEAVGGRTVPDGDVAFVQRAFGLEPRGRPSTMTLTGSNALFRREVFASVRFDPRLREGEDIALNHDLAAAGFAAAAVPGLAVEHRENKSFFTSLLWMYQSGRGASRQFERYREVRLPDLAFAGTLLSAAAGAVSAVRRRRALPAALAPSGWLVVVSATHMLACFRPSRRTFGRFCCAVVVDLLMTGSYSIGRFAGHFGRRLGV